MDDQQYCPEYDAFMDLYEDFCKALPIKKLLPGLLSSRVIDFDDKEELCHGEASDRVMVEKFMDTHLFHELAIGDSKRFYRFVDVMRRSQKCNHLVEKLDEKIYHYHSVTARATQSIEGDFCVGR